jgi:hypothetical protein
MARAARIPAPHANRQSRAAVPACPRCRSASPPPDSPPPPTQERSGSALPRNKNHRILVSRDWYRSNVCYLELVPDRELESTPLNRWNQQVDKQQRSHDFRKFLPLEIWN